MRITKLDIDNAEQLERTAEERERGKKLRTQAALLSSAHGLQGELLAVLIKHNATYNEAHAALEGLSKTYESLPFDLRRVE